MQKLIIPLQKIRTDDFLSTGGKAFNIARLSRAGFLVPGGFCIKADAFREHLKINNISIDAANNLSGIRQSIINAPLAENLKTQIEYYYNPLSAGCVAVRSSATAEDLPNYSFAGQYDTYLNISSLAECFEAVKKCWASLWTDRAYEYCKNNGIDHSSVDMAVIVQELIEADTSGVLFTADPVNGYKSRMVIEAVAGLGDKLVSGKVSPQRFIIDKNTFRIVRNGGNIGEQLLKNLAKSAKKVEKKFGSPQDIEWAIKNNKIYFLQTRPITKIPPLKPWDERQVWTNANAGEVIPDVVTPMTWSIVGIFVIKIFGSLCDWFGVKLGDYSHIGLIAGRIYFNINSCVGVLKHTPRKLQSRFDDLFGGEHKDMFEKGLLDIPQENVPNIKFSLLKFLLNMPVFIFKTVFTAQKRAESFITRLNRENDYLDSLKFDFMSTEELVKIFNAQIKEGLGFEIDDATGFLNGFYSYLILNIISEKWLKDETLTARLWAGAGNMEHAEAGIELWRLASQTHKYDEIEKIILTGGTWKDVEEKIAKNPRGREFLDGWNAFMRRFGHHTRGEAELFNPRWFEMPDYILQMVRGYFKDIETYNPVENRERQKFESQRLCEQCRKNLRNPLKRSFFNLLLKQAKQGIVFRENVKSQFIRRMAFVRRMLLWFGSLLEKQGIIENADDIFFLEHQEIAPVLQKKAEFNIKKIIAERKEEYEKDKSIIPPKVIIGKFDIDNFVPDEEKINTDIKLFRGIAVSHGIARGRAKVILRADMNECVKAGEILVAPFTDPGWTPYFMSAAGIVMDMGGQLSHGSIIAREYGIPAVVNVGPATKIIQNGQMLEVDGDKGIVRIL